MMFKEFLPKGMKIPEMSCYKLTGVNFETAKSYLAQLPVTDRTLGIEYVISKESIRSSFFIEFYKADIPLQIGNEYLWQHAKDICDYYSCHPSKPSIFPFQCVKTPVWNKARESLCQGEEVLIQLLFIKKTNPVLSDSLWTQYEDYVNGVEQPTTNVVVRSLQQKMLELLKRIDGGYRKHARITESEDKLKEDLFSFEARFVIAAEYADRNIAISDLIKDTFQRLNFVNTWRFSKETNKIDFAEHIRLRRFSLFRKQQYLSVSELAGFFVTDEATEAVDHVSSIATTVPVNNPEVLIETSPFSILPTGTKKSRESDFMIAGQFNNSLRKLALINDEDVIVQKIQHGATVRRITFTLPEGLKLTSLKKSIVDLQTEMTLSDISIVQGATAGTAILSIPQEERETVFLRDCVDDADFIKFSKSAHLPLIFGLDENGNPIFIDLVAIKHLLVVGSTGSGKSVCLHSLLIVLMTLVSPNDLKVIMIDPKMVELQAYSKYPHVQQVFTDMDKVEGVLCYLCEKMDERYSKFKDKGYKNIQQHNRNEATKMPYIVLVIDELADLIMTNPENEDYLVRLAQKARAAGIHLIIATQRPIKEVVTGLIKANIYSRVCFACDSGISYRVALDETPPFNLLGKGDGAYRFEGVQGLNRFQGALIAKTEEEQDKIIEKLSSHWKIKGNKDVIDIDSSRIRKIEKELNEFKRLVLETGETRVTELQKIMSTRNEKVKELMTQLIGLGWVVQHKSRAKGFELLLNEDQRKRELERLSDK